MSIKPIVIFEDALNEYRHSAGFLDWVSSKESLANQIMVADQTSNEKEMLDIAVESSREALESCDQDKAPEEWANAQFKLAVSLQAYGLREPDGMEALTQSVEAYKKVLTVWRRQNLPLEWSIALNNLGMVFQNQGERIKGAHLLEMSVATFNNALTVRSSDDTPREWAVTQNSFGLSLQLLGEYKQEPKMLIDAIKCFENALQKIEIESNPVAWFMITNNLGTVRLALAEQTKDVVLAKEAVSDFDRLVTFFSESKRANFKTLADEYQGKAQAIMQNLGGS